MSQQQQQKNRTHSAGGTLEPIYCRPSGPRPLPNRTDCHDDALGIKRVDGGGISIAIASIVAAGERASAIARTRSAGFHCDGNSQLEKQLVIVRSKYLFWFCIILCWKSNGKYLKTKFMRQTRLFQTYAIIPTNNVLAKYVI